MYPVLPDLRSGQCVPHRSAMGYETPTQTILTSAILRRRITMGKTNNKKCCCYQPHGMISFRSLPHFPVSSFTFSAAIIASFTNRCSKKQP
jgi:hypothetical protein